MTDLVATLEEYRGLREALESSILPLATSVDGRRFEFQASLHDLEREANGYVSVDARGESRLRQVLSLRMEELGDRAATFAQGEPFVAGKIASRPALIRVGPRITEEGGADVVGWR